MSTLPLSQRDLQLLQVMSYLQQQEQQKPQGVGVNPLAAFKLAKGAGLLGAGATGPGLLSQGVSGIGSLFGGGGAANMTSNIAANYLPGIGAQTTAAPIMSTMPAASGIGAALLPAAGIAAGAYTGLEQIKGGANVLKGKDLSFTQQAALALPTFGLSFAYNPIKKMFNKNRSGEERKRLEKLRKSGVYVPDEYIAGAPTKGRSFDELQKMEIARGADEADIKFAKSRDLNDLKGHGQSLIGYSAWAEKDPEWFKKSVAERTKIANEYLDAGAVSEGRGQIKLDPSKLGRVAQTKPLPIDSRTAQLMQGMGFPNVKAGEIQNASFKFNGTDLKATALSQLLPLAGKQMPKPGSNPAPAQDQFETIRNSGIFGKLYGKK